MFRVPSYYLITPNSRLNNKFLKIDIHSDLVESICTDHFWEYYSGAGNSFRDNFEDIIQVKMLFLASLMSDYLSKDELYQRVFETDSISLETFDNWWNIQRYLLDETFEGVQSTISSSVTKHFVKTGIFRVDCWIEEMQKGSRQP
jgi:hypothetical protein